MAFLFLGDNFKLKDEKISALKKSLCKDPQAVHFDYEALDAHDLPADVLKKSLITLPVVGHKRLVIVRNIHKLKSADVAALLAFLNNPLEHIELVLESSESVLKGDLSPCASLCRVLEAYLPQAGNAFDMTRLMSAGKAKEALQMLNNLYRESAHPLQIMGVLAWYWGKEGRVFGTEKFERGMMALEEADLNIKRSRLKGEYAVEKLVVELMAIRRR